MMILSLKRYKDSIYLPLYPHLRNKRSAQQNPSRPSHRTQEVACTGFLGLCRTLSDLIIGNTWYSEDGQSRDSGHFTNRTPRRMLSLHRRLTRIGNLPLKHNPGIAPLPSLDERTARSLDHLQRFLTSSHFMHKCERIMSILDPD